MQLSADTQVPDLDLGSLSLGADISMEWNVAPDTEMHHEQPEKQAPVTVENLGVGQTSTEGEVDRKSTRLNSSHSGESRMPSSA